MHKGRLEAFSDGVIAIIITIMVLEIKMPGNHHDTLESLKPLFLKPKNNTVELIAFIDNPQNPKRQKY